MAIRIGGNNSSVDQLQQQQNNSSATRTTQQPAAQQANSAFQGGQVRQGTDARATARSSENIAANNLRGQLQGAPSLSSFTKDAAAVMRPATGGGTDSVAVVKTATPNARINDNSTVTSAINFPAGSGDVQSISVNVDIAHTYRGDLVVKLVSPSGKEAILTNKAGGSADNFVLSGKDLSTTFAGEKIDGDWKLVVQDTARADVGTLKSWGMSVEKKPTGGGGGGGQTGPTNLQIVGTPEFVQRNIQDINKWAPGATIDPQGYVRAPQTRQPGHEQGYRLLDDILAGGNGGNKKVTIQFTSQNAFTQSGAGATGTPTTPGAGSAATVAVDPSLNISLPTVIGKNADGTDRVEDRPISSEVILAHELVHAVHAQRGTIDRTNRDHTFTANGSTFKENWRFEELRTTGFGGFRQGNEASENSIRAELGFGNRATYLDSSGWTRVGGAPNAIAANAGATSGGEQLVGDSWRSAGAALPNGQFRICNCFAC